MAAKRHERTHARRVALQVLYTSEITDESPAAIAEAIPPFAQIAQNICGLVDDLKDRPLEEAALVDYERLSRTLGALQEMLDPDDPDEALQSCKPEELGPINTALGDFREAMETMRGWDALGEAEITIQLIAAPDQLKELAAQVQEALVEPLRRLQKTQAEALGFAYGQTPCCEKMGWNPPEGVDREPVHEFHWPSPQGLPPFLAQLLEMFGGGNGNGGGPRMMVLGPDGMQKIG